MKKEKALVPQVVASVPVTADNLPADIKDVVAGRLPETVEQACTTAAKIVQHGRSHMLMWVWAVGRIVDDQQKKVGDETGKVKGHGSDVAGQVAKAIGTSVKFVRDAKRFYADNPNADDVIRKSIDWSVARELLRVKGPETKKQLEAKASEKKMTVRDVREEVDKAVKAEKPDEEDDLPEPAPKPVSPLAYFRALLSDLETFQQQLTSRTMLLADNLNLVSDDKRCPDADYRLIAEGVDGGQPMVIAIAKKGLAISEHIQKYLEPLRRTFEPEPAPTEQPAKKK